MSEFDSSTFTGDRCDVSTILQGCTPFNLEKYIIMMDFNSDIYHLLFEKLRISTDEVEKVVRTSIYNALKGLPYKCKLKYYDIHLAKILELGINTIFSQTEIEDLIECYSLGLLTIIPRKSISEMINSLRFKMINTITNGNRNIREHKLYLSTKDCTRTTINGYTWYKIRMLLNSRIK